MKPIRSRSPSTHGETAAIWKAGAFSDNSTAFIMSTPLSSISESTMLSNRFLAYVGIFAVLIGGIVVYFVAGRLTVPINQLSRLSEKMSQLDFDARYEPEKGEYTEIGGPGKEYEYAVQAP